MASAYPRRRGALWKRPAHFLSVPLTAGDTLQDIIDRWAAQSEVRALWHPADCIALQLSRYSNGKLLTPVTLAPHRNVQIPNYVAADCHVQKVAYVLRCAVVHLGPPPRKATAGLHFSRMIGCCMRMTTRRCDG